MVPNRRKALAGKELRRAGMCCVKWRTNGIIAWARGASPYWLRTSGMAARSREKRPEKQGEKKVFMLAGPRSGSSEWNYTIANVLQRRAHRSFRCCIHDRGFGCSETRAG
jgi:hypothetical protein